MLQLIDGPCQGTFLVKRAPVFLRAVLAPGGEADVLDQIDDTPKAREKIYVYIIEGEAGWIHISRSPRSQSGFYATGQYRYLPDVDGEKLRDNKTWQAWAQGHFECPVDKKPCEKDIMTCCSCERKKEC
jgi:hypothetical protein